MAENPYQSPVGANWVEPTTRPWKGGADAELAQGGLLHRKVIVYRPLEVTVEYFARGLRDRVFVDGKTVVSRWPILWLGTIFEFTIPYADGLLPATIHVNTQRYSLRLARFELSINGVMTYAENNGWQA